jgi:hypothetical protein
MDGDLTAPLKLGKKFCFVGKFSERSMESDALALKKV